MFDIYTALGLVGIAISMFLVTRMRVLPKKTLPFMLAAIAGVVGISVFQNIRMKSMGRDIKRREKDLRKRGEKLNQMRYDLNLSDDDYHRAVAVIDKELEAGKKRALLINENRQKERKRISSLSGKELDKEFEVVMRSLDN